MDLANLQTVAGGEPQVSPGETRCGSIRAAEGITEAPPGDQVGGKPKGAKSRKVKDGGQEDPSRGAEDAEQRRVAHVGVEGEDQGGCASQCGEADLPGNGCHRPAGAGAESTTLEQVRPDPSLSEAVYPEEEEGGMVSGGFGPSGMPGCGRASALAAAGRDSSSVKRKAHEGDGGFQAMAALHDCVRAPFSTPRCEIPGPIRAAAFSRVPATWPTPTAQWCAGPRAFHACANPRAPRLKR